MLFRDVRFDPHSQWLLDVRPKYDDFADRRKTSI